MSDNGQQREPQVSTARRRHGCFYYGCLTLLLLAGGLIALVAAVFYYGRSVVLPSIDEFLTHIDRGKFREAYGLLTPAAQAETNFAQFEEHFTAVADDLGKHVELHATNVSLSSAHGGTASVVVDGRFERGTAHIAAVLVKTGGRWRIDQIKIEPAEVQTCEHCGAANGAAAEFCKRCGRRLKRAKEHPKPPPGQRVI